MKKVDKIVRYEVNEESIRRAKSILFNRENEKMCIKAGICPKCSKKLIVGIAFARCKKCDFVKQLVDLY